MEVERKAKEPCYRAAWANMILRCESPAHHRYSDYGARGIQVCERWHSFDNFVSDMGPRPFKHTLDRIDNDGPYEPSNCRWATSRQQNRNRRDNVYLTHMGVTKLLLEWAEEKEISHNALRIRIFRYGWDVTRALNTPVQRR